MKRVLRTTIGLVVALAAAVLWMRSDESNRRASSNQVATEILQDTSSTSIATVTETTTTNAVIIRAVDGDTLMARLDGESRDVKVRLLGVNTPESVDPRRPVQCFGKEASHFTASLADGKRARLEEDVEADDLDKYGRLLRNVILEDGTDLNLALVKEGYAYAYTSFPQNKKRKMEIKRLQEDARLAERGLWNPKTCAGKK